MVKLKDPISIKNVFAVRGMAQVLTVTFGLVVLCIIFGVLNPQLLLR